MEQILNFIYIRIIEPISNYIINIFEENGMFGGMIRIGIFCFIVLLIFSIIRYVLDGFGPTREEEIGTAFENRVAHIYNSLTNDKMIRNMLFPDGKGGTTELDMAFVTTKGIFCLECKCRGEESILVGNIDGTNWDVLGKNYTRDLLYNPLLQNQGHIIALSKVLANLPCHAINCVCTDAKLDFMCNGINYTDDAILLSGKKSAIFRSKIKSFEEFLEKIKTLPDVYTNEEIETIKEILKSYVATKEQMEKHKEYVALMNLKRSHN